MESLILNINPANGRVVSILGSVHPETQAIMAANPAAYAIIDDIDNIRLVAGAFGAAQSATSSSRMLPEHALYFENGALVKKPDMRAIKTNKVRMLSTICSATCLSGIVSDALGTDHFYPTSLLDQQNLAASVTASLNPLTPADWTVVIWCCVPGDDTTWMLREHNKQQVQALGEETLRLIETQRKHLRDLMMDVERVPDLPVESNVIYVRGIQW